MRTFTRGQVISAHHAGFTRDWVVTLTEPGVDILIADPLLRDDEVAAIVRTQQIYEKRGTHLLPGIMTQRQAIPFEDIHPE